VDDLFDHACRIVLEQKRGSASLLQRALQIGYTRASRLIDLMRGQGIIGEFKNAQAADVLVTLEEYEAKYGKQAEPS
jgi:S-DNA-T family DNA segregation ATPase FtsK/SpoIIIE